MSPATVTYILNAILTSTDPEVRTLAERYTWYIFPVINPDGYTYTFGGVSEVEAPTTIVAQCNDLYIYIGQVVAEVTRTQLRQAVLSGSRLEQELELPMDAGWR